MALRGLRHGPTIPLIWRSSLRRAPTRSSRSGGVSLGLQVPDALHARAGHIMSRPVLSYTGLDTRWSGGNSRNNVRAPHGSSLTITSAITNANGCSRTIVGKSRPRFTQSHRMTEEQMRHMGPIGLRLLANPSTPFLPIYNVQVDVAPRMNWGGVPPPSPIEPDRVRGGALTEQVRAGGPPTIG